MVMLLHSRLTYNLTMQQPLLVIQLTVVPWVSLASETLQAEAQLAPEAACFVSHQTVSPTSAAPLHMAVADLTTCMVAHQVVLHPILGLDGFSEWDTTAQWPALETSPTRLEVSSHCLIPSLLQLTTLDSLTRTVQLEQFLPSLVMLETQRVDSMSAQLLALDRQWFTASHQTAVLQALGPLKLCPLELEQHAHSVFLQHVLGLQILKTLTVETLLNTT